MEFGLFFCQYFKRFAQEPVACKTHTEKTASCMMDSSLHWLQLNLSQRVFINCWPQAKDDAEDC